MLNAIKLILASFAAAIWRMVSWRRDEIWLIGERPSEAKDNGYHLFKFIRINYPDQKIFYVIESGKSDQRDRVEKLGQIVDYDSFRHYYLFCRSSKLIMPFEASTFPASKLLWYLYRLKFLRKKTAFIQHGITKEKQLHYAYNNRFKFDLFVCGAKEEHSYVMSDLGYPPEVARHLGFPRYDSLVDTSKGQRKIFYMPTWRTWLIDCDEAGFKESTYFKEISAFLESNELAEFLQLKGARLVIYLHDALQKKGFSKLFVSRSQNLIVADSEKYDVQALMKESEVMITDFSSVAFDFAYMNKPVIYYQFDEGEYFSRHFIKGYFDYRDNGFGPVFNEYHDVVKGLYEIFENRFDDSIFCVRRQRFFPSSDTNNSLRNFEAIRAL